MAIFLRYLSGNSNSYQTNLYNSSYSTNTNNNSGNNNYGYGGGLGGSNASNNISNGNVGNKPIKITIISS